MKKEMSEASVGPLQTAVNSLEVAFYGHGLLTTHRQWEKKKKKTKRLNSIKLVEASDIIDPQGACRAHPLNPIDPCSKHLLSMYCVPSTVLDARKGYNLFEGAELFHPRFTY